MKITAKDVKEHMKKEKHFYASNGTVRFYILLRSGPNVGRYIVEAPGVRLSFTNPGDAVKLFNVSI